MLTIEASSVVMNVARATIASVAHWRFIWRVPSDPIDPRVATWTAPGSSRLAPRRATPVVTRCVPLSFATTASVTGLLVGWG